MPNHGAAYRDPRWLDKLYVHYIGKYTIKGLGLPRAPTYLNCRALGYETIGYIEPSSHYRGNSSPRDIYYRVGLIKGIKFLNPIFKV